MYKTHFFFCLFLVSLFASFFGCDDKYEDYSTNPRDLLSFSSDTIRFDTILTTINTPIRFLMVYNRNDQPLLISSVELKNGDVSGFKINVDGMAGQHFQNIAIRPKDSLFVLVDVKPEMNGEVIPTLLNDYIAFKTNGVEQKVLLEAYGQDVFIWEGKILSSDTIIENSKPILIRDSLLIEENTTLSIKEGTCFYMDNNARIIVKGSLKMKGSQEKPITFRGRRTDYMLTVSYDLIPGQWDGFNFHSTSFGNEMEHVHIRNGKSGLYFEVSTPDEEKLRMKNVVLTNFSENLLRATNCNITAENCEFSNSRFALLEFAGGKYSFTHCTMANYMPSAPDRGWANSTNETILLTNVDMDSLFSKNPIHYPLIQADFINTIIWGKFVNYGQLAGHSDVKFWNEEDVEFNYVFRNCILPALNGKNGEHAVDCIFNKDPLFKKTDTKDEETGYFSPIFDFRLRSPEETKESSPATNAANPEYSINLPFDLDGNSRFADEKPDIGAYEFQTN
jgi:hypothetical protein